MSDTSQDQASVTQLIEGAPAETAVVAGQAAAPAEALVVDGQPAVFAVPAEAAPTMSTAPAFDPLFVMVATAEAGLCAGVVRFCEGLPATIQLGEQAERARLHMIEQAEALHGTLSKVLSAGGFTIDPVR
jgi:hypothetical protein